MITEASQISKDSVIQSDICIVGGGAAGIALSTRLSSSSLKVVVLESGGLFPDADTQNLAKGEFSSNYGDLDSVRIRSLGGTTFHWNGYHRPFDRADFEDRPWVPNSGWPIRQSEIDAYYPDSLAFLELHEDDFNLSDLKEEFSLELPELDPDRFYHRVSRIRPVRFGRKFEESLRTYKNIDVILRANCTQLGLNKETRSIDTVSVASLDGNRFSVKSRVVILASGGIENVRLLLASQGMTAGGLGNEHDVVGRYFMEHPHMFSGFMLFPSVELKDKAINTYFPEKNDPIPSIAIQPAVQEREQMGNFLGNIRPFYGYPTDDMVGLKSIANDWIRRDISTDTGKNILSALHNFDNVAVEVWRRLLNYERVDNIDRVLAISATIEQIPNPESRVTLTDDVDALGMRRVKLDWRLTDFDMQTIKKGWKLVGNEFARLGAAKTWLRVPEKNDDWPDYLHWGYHHMGTTRMSDDAKSGVVDRDCKVHGIENLYIAGSSVFPTAGSSTPTTTLLALALRLADHVKQEISDAG